MLRQIQPIGPLRDPVVIASFVQGNGINSTAAATLAHLVQRHGAEAVAEFEPHQYFDFSVRRPMVRVERGRRVIDWPQNRIHLLKGKDTGRDALILSGIEPHLRWREFSESIAGLVPGGTTVSAPGPPPGEACSSCRRGCAPEHPARSARGAGSARAAPAPPGRTSLRAHRLGVSLGVRSITAIPLWGI